MNMRKSSILVFALVLAVLGLSSHVWARTERLSLQAEKTHPGATGTLTLSGTDIRLEAKGLRPDAVYTVWFVNMKPQKQEVGAGQAPYSFRTDAQGNGSYSSTLTESPFGRWQTVMVVLHPDGDPSNMKNMVGALSVKIPERTGRGYGY